MIVMLPLSLSEEMVNKLRIGITVQSIHQHFQANNLTKESTLANCGKNIKHNHYQVKIILSRGGTHE